MKTIRYFETAKEFSKWVDIPEQELWDRGLNLDDYDYILVIKSKINLEKYYSIEQLLRGCCDNRWYKLAVRGKEYTVGIAYHS